MENMPEELIIKALGERSTSSINFEVDQGDFKEFKKLYIKLLKLNKTLYDANSSIMLGDTLNAKKYQIEVAKLFYENGSSKGNSVG